MHIICSNIVFVSSTCPKVTLPEYPLVAEPLMKMKPEPTRARIVNGWTFGNNEQLGRIPCKPKLLLFQLDENKGNELFRRLQVCAESRGRSEETISLYKCKDYPGVCYQWRTVR